MERPEINGFNDLRTLSVCGTLGCTWMKIMSKLDSFFGFVNVFCTQKNHQYRQNYRNRSGRDGKEFHRCDKVCNNTICLNR
jgi:hypothetical protein